MKAKMRQLILTLLRIYKLAISPLLGKRCRFYPTCSDYAHEAIVRYGPSHGLWLALKRVARCHPFSRGGVDLVPEPHPSHPQR